MRKAFDRFAENHALFISYFPLDAEREAIYAETPLDEEKATGPDLARPFQAVAKAVAEAHKAGLVTDDFLAVINSMENLGQAISTLPTTPAESSAKALTAPEIKVSPEDRTTPVTVKKRTILGALGFYESSSRLIDEKKFNLAASGVQIASALGEAFRNAVQLLSRFIPWG